MFLEVLEHSQFDECAWMNDSDSGHSKINSFDQYELKSVRPIPILSRQQALV